MLSKLALNKIINIGRDDEVTILSVAKMIMNLLNKGLRGYGGPCLPKDTKALGNLIKKLNLKFKLIESTISDNKYLKKTVFKGMRKI